VCSSDLRIDGPAVVWNDGWQQGTIEYYINGDIHRIGGPSLIEYRNNSLFYKSWRRYSKWHRLNAPAKIWFSKENASNEYYEFGIKIK
jgi:hypothetical protein